MIKKRSVKRDAVIQQLKSRKDHPTADDIYLSIRSLYPNISLGTVYRNLASLSNEGEILRINDCNGPDRFDGNPASHYHFQCTLCSRIIDVDMKINEELNPEAEKVLGEKVNGHVLMFYGECNICRKE